MNTLTARPRLLKQANLSYIRKVIKTKGTATRAEIASETNISSTTVRTLLWEMMENGEVESIGHDKSSGGRKAERYRLKPDRYYGIAFCITDSQVHGLLINICGDILEETKLEVKDKDYEQAMIPFLDQLIEKNEIKSIGIGVPGIVEEGSFWRKEQKDGELHKSDIGDRLAKKYQIPVIMENDLNATAIGFGRCYQKKYPCENPEKNSMAFLYFEKDCVSAGFIAGGKIIRGCNNFAGELGLVTMEDGRTLDQWIAGPLSEMEYINLVIRILSWICGILNPQYVVLGGPELRKECMGPISDGLSACLPRHMYAESLYASNAWHDYYEGMAYLTAGKMFDDIQFIKE